LHIGKVASVKGVKVTQHIGLLISGAH